MDAVWSRARYYVAGYDKMVEPPRIIEPPDPNIDLPIPPNCPDGNSCSEPVVPPDGGNNGSTTSNDYVGIYEHKVMSVQSAGYDVRNVINAETGKNEVDERTGVEIKEAFKVEHVEDSITPHVV